MRQVAWTPSTDWGWLHFLSTLFFSCLLSLISNNFHFQQDHQLLWWGSQWRFPGGMKLFFWGGQIFALHFPIDLLFRVWMTGDIMWSGGAGRQLLTEWRKVKPMQPLWKCTTLSQAQLRTHMKRQKERMELFPSVFCPKLGWQVTHCEVFRAGQLVSVVAPSHCFYWHHGLILLTPLITLLTLLTTSTDTTDCFYRYYWLLLPILLTTDWLSDYFF